MTERVRRFFSSGAGRVLSWVFRAALAGVFLAAAIPKILDPIEFAQSIDHYRVLPREIIPVFAAILPCVEVVVAFSLLTGIRLRGGALVALGMLAVFIGAMGQALARDINIECGCFGSAMPADVSWASILRNVALSCAALALLIGHSDRSRRLT